MICFDVGGGGASPWAGSGGYFQPVVMQCEHMQCSLLGWKGMPSNAPSLLQRKEVLCPSDIRPGIHDATEKLLEMKHKHDTRN